MTLKFNNEKYMVACSGGVDSMVLANYLHSLNKLDSLYHHVYLTPKEFSNDALKVVTNLSEDLKIPLYLTYECVSPNGNSEATWREQRYNGLSKYATERGIVAATGHHIDDQFTSYVLSKLKDSSRCFTPIRNRIQNVEVCRPFIYMGWDKSLIRGYAATQKVRYVEDPYNELYSNQRATIDHILPMIKTIEQTVALFKKAHTNWVNQNYEGLIL